jgi:hypothetical protein
MQERMPMKNPASWGGKVLCQCALALSLVLLDTDVARTDELEQAMALARKTLEFVERCRSCPELAARLATLKLQAAELQSPTDAQRGNLCSAVRQLRRQIIFAHPLLDFDRLLVNKCPPVAAAAS